MGIVCPICFKILLIIAADAHAAVLQRQRSKNFIRLAGTGQVERGVRMAHRYLPAILIRRCAGAHQCAGAAVQQEGADAREQGHDR